MALIDRVKNILLTPRTEWPVVAGEPATTQSLYTGYILILAAIGPVALMLRLGLMAGFGVGVALVSYGIGVVMVYVLAMIADALAPTFGGQKDFIGALKLVAYGFTAAWVGGVFHLIPFLGSILSLAAAAYSFYLFFLGAPVMKKCAAEKAVGYTIVVILCAIAVGAVLSTLLFSMSGLGRMGMM